MVKITTEIDGKKYELVSEEYNCTGCAFMDSRGYCMLDNKRNVRCFRGVNICAKLHGIWKEVKDED